MSPETALDFTAAVTDLDRATDRQARAWFEAGRHVGAVRTALDMVRAFSRAYYKEGAGRRGVPGLFAAVNAGMFPFLSYAKLWELRKTRVR